MKQSIRRSARARTRGKDPDNPLNQLTKSKGRRTMRDLLGEHRIEMMSEAKQLGLMAATDFEICEHWEITQPTLLNWRARDPAFDSALQLGAEIADRRVEQALYARATGYSFRSEDVRVVDGRVVKVPVIKHEPPNVTAMALWLKNRQPDRWSDKQDVNLTGELSVIKDDPRSIAMAIIATLREAAQASIDEATTIEHHEAAE